MPTFYGAIDLGKNELRNAVIQNLGAAPSTPLKGQIWMDTTNNILKWFDGTQWISAMSGSSLTPAASVSASAAGDASAVGTSSNYAREDHKHGREALGSVTAQTAFGVASANGSAVSISRSDHVHGTPVHDAAAHSAVPLSALAAATANLALGGFKLTAIADGTNPNDAVSKQQLDSVVSGFDAKASVRAASTGVSLTLSGTQTIDGVAVVANDRVLAKDQAAPSANGIYVVAAGAWTRATDMDSWAEVPGAFTFVEQGTVNADTGWLCSADQGGTLGTTSVTWTQFSAAGQITAGAGLTKTGNSLDVVPGDTTLTVSADSMVVNTAQIATVASLAGYSPTGRNLTAGAGLTGGGTLAADRSFDVGQGTGILVAADSVAVDSTVVALKTDISAMVKKYVAALSGLASPEVITHNLNTRDVEVQVLNGQSPYTAVEVDWDATTVNTVTIRYNPTLGAGYRAVVLG